MAFCFYGLNVLSFEIRSRQVAMNTKFTMVVRGPEMTSGITVRIVRSRRSVLQTVLLLPRRKKQCSYCETMEDQIR